MLFPVILKFFHSLCLWFFFFSVYVIAANSSFTPPFGSFKIALFLRSYRRLVLLFRNSRLSCGSRLRVSIFTFFFSSALSSYSGHVKVLSIGGGSTGHIPHPSCQYCPQQQSLTIADVCFRPIDICWQSALLQSILLFGSFWLSTRTECMIFQRN